MQRVTLSLVAVLLTATSLSARQDQRPNILFIAIDDLRPELGCYGVSEIQTPHIDALAKSGLTFNRAYCQLAVCNPSRVSLLTGLRPDSARVWDLATRFRHTVPDVVTLPQQFKKHGYHAVSFGKIFHNPWPDNVSWSEPHRWPAQSTLWSVKARQRHAAYKERMRDEGQEERAINRMRPQATEIVDVADHEHIDGAIAEQTLATMKRLAKGDQPFFLAAGFIRPHLPFVVPRKYWELYDADKIPEASHAKLPSEAPAFAMNTMYELRDYFDFDGTPTPDKGSLTAAQRRRLKHGYYASVSFIDALVGRLLAELDALGLADNTIVVLWGDHGWKLGEHNSWCKQTNYENDARVPLIIRAPDAIANGRGSDALVELVDIYPTLCELAGLPAPDHLEGRSVVPLLSKPKQSWKAAAFSQFARQNGSVPLMGYSMRTQRYRYIEWQDRRSREVVATELYDHKNDPLENTNIAGRFENKALLTTLNRQMWSILPQPPNYVQRRRRPQVVFHNRGAGPVTLYWVTPDGAEQKLGVIEAGKQLPQNTTIGHRFLVRDPHGRSKSFVVKQQRQTFEIRFASGPVRRAKATRPNIVFLMADDWSWPHAGILGDPIVKTPNFDRVAREGVLFENAFVSTPSCTPSRLSILTGQHHWRLREGDSLGGSLREEFEVYTELLQADGYRVGRFGKGVWPSKHAFRKRDSFGKQYKSFAEFIKDRKPGEPFCYWHGGQDPHRPYQFNIGEKSGIPLAQVKVPVCLPDNATVRSDVADYLWEVQRFDREVGEVVARLEAIGELDDTIIVVSGDNGMPFPRCKATLYDQGTRVPLAIRWGAKVAGGRSVTDFVSLCDLAPTFLEAAGLQPSKQMTGRSLIPILLSKESGRIDRERTFILTGMERHVYLYPRRALRTEGFLYIRNFQPEQWPTGEVAGHDPKYDFATEPWPTGEGAFSFNIDSSPSKQFLRLHRHDQKTKRYAELAFSRPPREELYDLTADPDQLHNVADNARYAKERLRLSRKLQAELIKSQDPRLAVKGYQGRSIQGWPVRISEQLLQTQKEATERALPLLEDQLQAITKLIPADVVARLRDVPIWLSPVYDGTIRKGEYHPDANWLLENGRHPALHQCVELTNVPIFAADIRRMPMLMLHELAHAYHHQVLDFEHAGIKAAYDRAIASGTYDKVRRNNGKTERAYAMTDHKEYFAECTEAFFGTNDFYPFNRQQLARHDPKMAKLLEELWQVRGRDPPPSDPENGDKPGEEEAAGKAPAPAARPRVVVVKPVVLRDDGGGNPAAFVLPKKLVDRVYTKAGLEFVYLEPAFWNHGQGRRGEVNLDRIVRDGRAAGVICRDRRVVTLLFVSAVDGQRGPLGRGQQNGDICFVTLGPAGANSDPAMQAFVVAHEIGHCLNLRHAVDDPAVPDDVPNLQGEGAFEDRLAVAGLHDSQRDTVLRSPLVLNRMELHDVAKGRRLLVDESWEPYITAATDDMLRFSIGLKADVPLPHEAEARQAFAQQRYAEKVLEFTDQERALLRRVVTRLNTLIGESWPLVARLPWHFIKVDASFCKGMAHTRGMAIVLTERHLRRMRDDEKYGLELLLHEKMHVVQRLNPARFAALYEKYGLRQAALASGETERLNVAQNPDALRLDWAIDLGDRSAMMVTVLGKGRNGGFRFENVYRTLRRDAEGEFVFGPELDERDRAFRRWRDSFVLNTGHDHPNEISAYLSGLLLARDFLGATGRPLSKSHAKHVEQTRQAFRQALRIDGD